MAFNSCSDDSDDGQKTYAVIVQLAYPDGIATKEKIEVSLYSAANSATYKAETDATGKAVFTVIAGVYEASATDKRSIGGVAYIYNGLKSNVSVTDQWNVAIPVDIELKESKTNQIVIKELYVGGCQKDDGSGTFINDKYVILYNNSEAIASLDKICLGVTLPYNSNGTNRDYVNGVLSYESEGWIPAGTGIWYFTNSVSLEPGKQIVIALNNAVDNTALYSKSINFNNSEYYCTYDLTAYANTTSYPTPVGIPASHHMKAYHYGTGSAWVISINSPAFFIFSPKEDLADFVTNASKTSYYNNLTSQVRKKVPVEWVVDGIEVFRKDYTDNNKRLTADVDGGYVYYTDGYGYTLYRNVDKEATLAIEGNESKLIYSYSLGTETTDISGIDAEASIKNGARIVYKDTNNSTNDFHQRSRASLRN
jgi:hypothetical protein